MLDSAFFAALAFLEMLSKGGPGPSVVPPSPPPPAPNVPVVPVPVAPPIAPGVLPPMPPWNQGAGPACPSSLPPFPGPGWVPDNPVSLAIAARASYWNPILWDYASQTVTHPGICEQFGGRWLQFVAAWHPGDSGPQTYMATECWRLASDQPMPPPGPLVIPLHLPQPMPPPGVLPDPVVPPPPPVPVAPVVVQTPLQAAAVAMASALNTHGYKLADQPLYKAFQRAAGTTQDGFPGTGTMGRLRAALATVNLPMPSVPIYPWRSMPGTSGYDGVNAPVWPDWTGVPSGVPSMQPAAPSGPPAPVQPYPGSGAYKSNAAYIARYQSALTYLAYQTQMPAFDPQGVDGKYGPNTTAAVKAYQTFAGLPADGACGAATAARLDASVAQAAATSAAA
jgi:peptidoglycan hydrolase-like protein with peptidoglycan-binding domain